MTRMHHSKLWEGDRYGIAASERGCTRRVTNADEISFIKSCSTEKLLLSCTTGMASSNPDERACNETDLLSVLGSLTISDSHPQSISIATPRVSERIRYNSLCEGSSYSLSMGSFNRQLQNALCNCANANGGYSPQNADVQSGSPDLSGYYSYWNNPADRGNSSTKMKNDVMIEDSSTRYSDGEQHSPVDKTLSQTQKEVEEKIAELKNELEQNENELTSVITQTMINQQSVEQKAKNFAQRKIAEIRAAFEKEQNKLMAEKSALNQKLQECVELKSRLNEVIERSRKLSLDVDPGPSEPRFERRSWPLTSTLTPPAFAGPRSLVLRDISSPVCQLFDGNQLSKSKTPIAKPTPANEVVKNGPGVIGDRRLTRTSPEPEVPFGPLAQCQRPPVIRHAVVKTGRRQQLSRAVKIVDGNKGQGEDKLCRPWGIACYPGDGRIFVVDRSHHRILVYNSKFKLMQRFGTLGSDPGQFHTPAGIAVDADSRVVIADKDNHRIQIFTLEGRVVLVFGKQGKEPGDFNFPWDVATNSKCEIVVSDSRNHRIQLFDSKGTFLRLFSFIKSLHVKPQDLPRSVAFTPEGDIVLTNFNTHAVMKVPKDFSTAIILTRVGSSSEKNGLFRPQGIDVDSDGNIIVADSRNNRVQVFDKYGKHLWSFGEEGKADYQMNRPAGITLLPNGNVALVDYGNNRLMMF